MKGDQGMTEFEKAIMKMKPADRKKAVNAISGQMGMPSKKKQAAKKKSK